MPPWIAYTTKEADSLLGPMELDQIQQHLGEDYRQEHLESVVATVRGYCAARGELGEPGTIPPECRHAFRSLYRYGLLAALPVDNLMTPARQQEYDAAQTFLRDVGRGTVGITRPDPVVQGPETIAGKTPASPSICAPRRNRDARSLDGS